MTDSQGELGLIPEDVRAEMYSVSWHEDTCCPPFDDLVLLRVPYLGFDGREHRGELIVARSVGDAVLRAFAALRRADYPIARMERIERFGGDDRRSMAANNCSGFNFRRVDGEDRLSMHALGLAIDINPVQNPWIRGNRVDPERGRAFVDRTRAHPALIRRPSLVIEAFADIGWEWGGDWPDYQDYHHFQAARSLGPPQLSSCR